METRSQRKKKDKRSNRVDPLETRNHRKKNNKRSNKASQRNRIDVESEEVLTFGCKRLKSMVELRSIDDGFYLSVDQIIEIQNLFSSRRSASTEEYMSWNLYAKAFYLKAHSSCHNRSPLSIKASIRQEKYVEFPDLDDYQSSDAEKHMEFAHFDDHQSSDQEGLAQPLTDEDDSSSDEDDVLSRPSISGPFKFGYYSEETAPCRIPYHLYLLIKEAVDIMDSNPDDVIKLENAEIKIEFFCNYFHSHLPVGWKYKRHNARNDVDSYDTKRQPRYDMSGYTPFSSRTGRFNAFEYDEDTNLSRGEMIAIMGIIHSRETPKIWEMDCMETKFYCNICSCFGIDYHYLEAASEDDVCLMKVDCTRSF